MRESNISLEAGVISSAFVNLLPTKDERFEIQQLFNKPEWSFLNNKLDAILHLPLGMKWCLRHEIPNFDILVSGSFFKVLLPSGERSEIRCNDALNDGFGHLLYESDNILLWANRFNQLIDASVEYARNSCPNAASNPESNSPLKRKFEFPSLATNFPNISFSIEDHPESHVLWKRSVFALASCMVAAHKRKPKIKIIEIVAGAVLDRYKPDDDRDPWKLQLFSNHNETRNEWMKRFAEGIWTAFVLARHVLTQEERKKNPHASPQWPDCRIAIELEPEPCRLANHPNEILTLIETTENYIRNNYDASIKDKKLFVKDIDETKNDSISLSDAVNKVVSNVGINLDIGHIAMLLQRSSNSYKPRMSLEEQTMRFLNLYQAIVPSSAYTPLLTDQQKTDFWKKIFHSHLSDHGLIHNKDQVPLSMLPKEFYIPFLRYYKERSAQIYDDRKVVAFELEAASTTGEVGAGYHYIVEMLDAV